MDIFGLTDRGMSQGAFALILKEADGPRKMPIIIGVSEAQAIANELEGVRPQRPMTHDLIRSIVELLGGQLKEVVIHSLREGTFYASLVFEYSNLELDARPSDAIAIAIRFGVPIYVSEQILNEAAIDQPDTDEEPDADETDDTEEPTPESIIPDDPVDPRPRSAREQLEQELDEAIRIEDYEKAAKIRDQLNRG